MSIEYLPVGISCNLQCGYCYQDPMRDAGNISVPRSWPKVQAQLLKEGSAFALFGGEPLLAPIEHVEEVFKFGLEHFGSNGIQTNGTLITDQHIELFKRYKVGVGISVDGPDELNSARKSGTTTREATGATHSAIHKLCQQSHAPSLIVTLHKENAGDIGKLNRMVDWMSELESLGIKHVNLHILETEKCHTGLALTQAENIQAFHRFYQFSKKSQMTFLPFADIRKLLMERNPSVSCVWNQCDPLTTAAVRGVGPDGSSSNCGRTNKDGINWLKGDTPGIERYILLHQTPQEFGGCKDCRFFAFCKGQCPGTAIDGDWRNRTVDCQTWYEMFSIIEYDLIAAGKQVNTQCSQIMQELENRVLQLGESHGDSPHGDNPHGDEHGDHTDTEGVPVQWRD